MKNTVSAFLAISGLSFVTALVAESSLEPRIVPPPDEACKTYASGYLAANITGACLLLLSEEVPRWLIQSSNERELEVLYREQ